MNKKIKTFIFDCFGVIYDPPISGWYKSNMLKNGNADNKLKDVLNDFDLGKLSEDDLYDYFSKYEGITVSKEEIRNEIDSYLKLDLDLVNIIKTLKKKGYKTALLSNGHSSFFERKIYKVYPEFKDLFDVIIISSDVGMVKPDKEIYLHSLDLVKSNPDEVLFIDDRQENVDGATNVGMHGYVYTTSDSFKDFIISLNISIDN